MYSLCNAFSSVSLQIRKNSYFDIDKWYSAIIIAILSAIMYGNQKLSTTLLMFTHCIHTGENKYVFISAETECWQPWQLVILSCLIFITIP